MVKVRNYDLILCSQKNDICHICLDSIDANPFLFKSLGNEVMSLRIACLEKGLSKWFFRWMNTTIIFTQTSSKMIITYHIFNYKQTRLKEIHEKNYIHHDLHSGNIFSHFHFYSLIGDLGLCQQVINKRNNSNEIFGVISYLAPEVLSKKPYTRESDIYSFGMIMWEHTTFS